MYLLRVTESCLQTITAEPYQHHIKLKSDCSMGAKSGNFKLQFIHNTEDALWQELSSHQYMYHKGRRITEGKVC